MMPVRIRAKRGVDRTQALALLPLAQRAATPYPNDATAQALLAEVEYDAGNFAAAEAAARRAVATDPKSVDGHTYLGMAQMAQARAAKDASPERWRAVRRSFLAANAIENDDPEPLLLYYQTYRVPGQTPTANARDALLRAHLLAPQDRGLRMQAARILLETGRLDEARRVLGPVAYSPHGGRSAALAQRLISLIDNGGAKAALDHWRGKPQPAANDTDEDDDKGGNAG
jgi:Flp pilus assembly protein TadD